MSVKQDQTFLKVETDKNFQASPYDTNVPGPIAQSVLSPIADPGIASSILGNFHAFVVVC